MIYSKHVIVLITLLPFFAGAQIKWKEIHLDNNLSFSIPSAYREVDTLGQVNFFATCSSSYIQVVKIPQPQSAIKNEDELIQYYKDFQKITIDQSNGSFISDSTIRMSNLCARVFMYQDYWNDSLQIQEHRIVLIGRFMYSFTHAYIKEKKLKAVVDRDHFFSGIKFYAVDFEDQLTVYHRNKQFDEYMTFIYRNIVPAAFLLAIIIWAFKKIRKS